MYAPRAFRRLPPLLALSAALLGAPAPARPADSANSSDRLGTDAVPTSEALRLEVDATKPGYSGTAVIGLEVRRATDAIRFHARDMKLTRVELVGRAGRLTLAASAGEEGAVTARAPSVIAPGAYTLEIDFAQPFGTLPRGLYKVVTGGESYAFTDFEPDDARRAWPCWDEPSFKIPWRLTVTVPAGQEAVSNTPVESRTAAGATATVAFKETKPLPSYLVALATGPLEFVPIRGMSVPGNVVTPKGRTGLAAAAAGVAPAALAGLESYFGSRYPYEKLDVLAVPEFYAGAMENAGAITFREDLILLDPAATSARQKSRLASTMTHELAHMWFGDQVTLAWWDDVWLNESFASWLGDKVTARVFPEFGGDVRQARSMERALLLDEGGATRAVHQPLGPGQPLGQLFDALSYQKGEAVLGMFEAWLGPESFRRGVIDYLAEHAWGNAVSADLWRALSRAAGREVGPAMATFLDQPGVPMVRVEAAGAGAVRLTQERFHAAGAPVTGERWQVPVFLKYDDGDSVRTQTVLLTEAAQTVKLAGRTPPTWILPNAGQRGYYRWCAPGTGLTALAAKAGPFLDARERVGFVANAAALLDAGDLHGDEFLELLARFAGDGEPQVVDQTLDGLAKVRDTFADGGERADFAAYVRRTLSPALARWGRAAAPGEPEGVSLLRPNLLTWLAVDGQDAAVLAYAESLATAYRANPASVDPALADAALDLAATRGDHALFADYRARFESAASPVERTRYLAALAWFRAPDLVDSALAYATSGPLRPQERFAIPRGLAERPELQDRVYRWMTETYQAFVAFAPMAAPYMPGFAAGCSAARLAAAQTFFAEHPAPGVEAALARVADEVNACVGLRAREGAEVKAYLERARPPR